jgi:rod shape-determining protein MreD
MKNFTNIDAKTRLHRFLPIIMLFFSVLNEIDFNNLGLKYFSFNFSYILIFYYSLKRSESLGLISIFVAGLFNDVIVGLPVGTSSLIYLLLCAAAAYLKNITLSPSPLKDWFFFLITILCLNSITYIILNFLFNFEVSYLDEIINVIFTFLFYIIFSYFFGFIERHLLGSYNAR